MNGWTGKILKIDLNNKKSEVIEPSVDIYHNYIGGRGLAGYYLKEWVNLDCDDPRMPVLFFTGPLVQTTSPTSGRMTVMSRSPLTGTIGDTSVGGKFGSELKRAGWDGIIITGKADKLTGIHINNNEIEYHNAENLKQKTVSEIREEVKGGRSTACTGPAADNGCLFANIIFDGHYCSGRNGLGISMANKQLKYITIQGNNKTKVNDPALLKKAREEILRLSAASPILQGELGITHFGTGAIFDLIDGRRMMPTNNFKATHFDNAESMNAYQYKQKYQTKKAGCQGCHLLCKQMGKDGKKMPEFETMSHFSALINNKDMDVVVEANRLCDELGIDTITAGATIACYREIENRELSGEEILKLLNDVAYSKDIGEELKLGSLRYAEKHNKKSLSMTVKSQEMPAYDPRGAYGMALAYATSTRGACHLRAYPIAHEILRKPVATDRFTFSGKARIIKISEDLNAVIDSLTACKFLFFAASLEEFATAYTAVTGVSTTAQDLLACGERIYMNEREMNCSNGFSAVDDDLPERFFKEAGSSGNGITVNPIDREDFLKCRSDYYKIRGLNEEGMTKND